MHGVDAFIVHVEVNIASGLPAFTVVGLPHGSVREGRERVGAALRNTQLGLPNRRITVNLAPADVRKDGTAFDLPIAMGVLAAHGRVSVEKVAPYGFLGELGLDGTLRPVPAVLPIAARCRAEGVRALVVPTGNAKEAGLVRGLEVFGAQNLVEVVNHVEGVERVAAVRVDPSSLLDRRGRVEHDLVDVRGQTLAKRVLEIAAAGGHNLLMFGPPGAGKTMLARRLPGILPPLTLDEALETTRVHSVAGRLRGATLVTARPFRAPHHSVSYAGLVGGGTPVRPGEVSLAHNGVLFLDELGEFSRSSLEVLRQPLEEGSVRLSRARGSVRFPARFVLVAAMNPCPCGHSGDGSERCVCDARQIQRYVARLSGPLLDRIDLHVYVPPVPIESLNDGESGLSSGDMARSVAGARAVQRSRFEEVTGVYANGHMSPAEMRRFCRPSPSVARFLQRAVDGLGLSARAYHRVLKVGRTIADLEGAAEVATRHVAEAVQYRMLRRPMDG